MSDEKVILFRPRPRAVSEEALEIFRHATRNWDPQLRELMSPEHAQPESGRPED